MGETTYQLVQDFFHQQYESVGLGMQLIFSPTQPSGGWEWVNQPWQKKTDRPVWVVQRPIFCLGRQYMFIIVFLNLYGLLIFNNSRARGISTSIWHIVLVNISFKEMIHVIHVLSHPFDVCVCVFFVSFFLCFLGSLSLKHGIYQGKKGQKIHPQSNIEGDGHTPLP